jgi:DNA polymerase-3 subunit epsilon
LVNQQFQFRHKTAVHGITDDKVANEPTFKELAAQVYNMIKDSDLAGFNSIV